MRRLVFFQRRFAATGGSIEKRVGTIDFSVKTFWENKAGFGIELDSDLLDAQGLRQIVNLRVISGAFICKRGRVYQRVWDFRG